MIAISHAHAAEPQRKVDRASHPEDTVIDLGGGVKIGGGHFQVIAGPCSVEGDNLLTIAARCKAAGAAWLQERPRAKPPATHKDSGSKPEDVCWCPIAMLSRTLGHQVCIAVFGKSILLRITFG